MNSPKSPRTAEEATRIKLRNSKKRASKKAAKKAAKKSQLVAAGMEAVPALDEGQQPTRQGWDLREDAIDPAEELQHWVNLANKGWPWSDHCPEKLITQGPFAVSEYRVDTGFFSKPQVKQNSLLLNLQQDLQNPILSLVFQYHGVASKLAATCQQAFHMATFFVDHWDISRAEFNECEKSLVDEGMRVTMGKVVLVSQFRNRDYPGVHFECELYSLGQMTNALRNCAERFETLHLHRIPMLTPQLLALVVPHMRKLKMLGVYRCELIHVGHTMRLLEILRTNRDAGMTKNIALDFYPRYHVGPESEDLKEYTGTYGVTWDNFKLDSRLAIWQILSVALPQAKKQGVDLISKDSAFRLWLDQLPLWRLDDTIHSISYECDSLQLAAQLDFPHTWGHTSKLPGYDDWCGRYFHCDGCDTQVLGIFFDVSMYREMDFFGHLGGVMMVCLGCMLSQHLDQENDHYKLEKLKIVHAWLGNNTDDLEQACSISSIERGQRRAAHFDKARLKREARGDQWVQAPYGSHIKYSPTVGEVEPKRGSPW